MIIESVAWHQQRTDVRANFDGRIAKYLQSLKFQQLLSFPRATETATRKCFTRFDSTFTHQSVDEYESLVETRHDSSLLAVVGVSVDKSSFTFFCVV